MPRVLSRWPPMIFCVSVVVSGCTSSTPPNSTPAARVSHRRVVPQGSVSFTSQEHGFAVWLPTRPVLNRKWVQPRNAPGYNQLLFKSSANAINYVVSIAPHAIPPTQWETSLDETQQGMLIIRHARLKQAWRIQQGRFPGRDVEVNLDQGDVVFRSRFYFTPKGSYAVAASGYRQDMQRQRAQINRSFDSFRLLLP